MPITSTSVQFIQWFDQISFADIPMVGGKNASLGEMIRELAGKGVKVPNGFATTADAYRAFLSKTGLDEKISQILADLNTSDNSNLRERGKQVRQAILAAELPADFKDAIREAYADLNAHRSQPVDVAVRSSATIEDMPDATFPGKQETYLNVQGEHALLDACHRCFASLFTDRAISYRVDMGFDHSMVAMSIGVQRMVRADLGSSGVMFSLDPQSGFRDAVLISAAYGLGENIVRGAVNPDEYHVFKPTLDSGHRPILNKKLGTKEFKMIYDEGGEKATKDVPVSVDDRNRFALNDDDILALARWACIIEDHYSSKKGHPCPVEMEWARDGITGELNIVQARPETVHSQITFDTLETFHLAEDGKHLTSGSAVGNRIATGKVRLLSDVTRLDEFQDGEILVTDTTEPDWEPLMKRAAGIVTNRGGRTCHAAIVSRELGVPAIVGCINATESVYDGQDVTISCAEGDTGVVYEGHLHFEIRTTDIKETGRPKTKVMMNVARPDEAFSLSMIPNDGVGLARMEFIINNHIKVHPLALLRFDQLKDIGVRKQIEQLTAAHENKAQYFVDTLAQGVSMIAAAFFPKEVIVRMSDFKSNEYANLIGGEQFEPTEENPMIGFRGASRYYDERYRDAFGLECQTMKKVREEMGLTNVKLMIPFCRTVEEGRRVQEEMARHGLVRGENGLEIYIMSEIPSNVIAAEAFAEIFDGFSIGSNDLTQLTLGVDRDSEIVAHVFSERDPAVMALIKTAIAAARKTNRKIGICGQAPSDYPDFAQFLVEQGIDSISLIPDAVLMTTVKIKEMEERLKTSRLTACPSEPAEKVR